MDKMIHSQKGVSARWSTEAASKQANKSTICLKVVLGAMGLWNDQRRSRSLEASGAVGVPRAFDHTN